jgi:hypothetical protein
VHHLQSKLIVEALRRYDMAIPLSKSLLRPPAGVYQQKPSGGTIQFSTLAG